MKLIKNKFLFIGVLIFCSLGLAMAYFVEYFLNHAPCNLCLIERVPYIATIIFSFLVLFFKKYEKIVLNIIGLFFVIGTVVSFYHFGIEQGFFNESLVCDFNIRNSAGSAEELLKELKIKSISCKNVTFKIFGLSLATLNTVISFGISVTMFRASLNYEKN